MAFDYRSQNPSIRPIDEDRRSLDDLTSQIRLENLRIQDDLPVREDISFRDTLRVRDDGPLRETPRYRDDIQFRDSFRDNLRFRDDFRRCEEFPTRSEIRDLRYQNDIRRAEDAIRRDSLPLPRTRDPDYLPREPLSPLSFDKLPPPRVRDVEFQPRGDPNYLRRRPLSPPLARDVDLRPRGSLSFPLSSLVPDTQYQNIRNPFKRRDSLYRD
jgi:hypothetical protein